MTFSAPSFFAAAIRASMPPTAAAEVAVATLAVPLAPLTAPLLLAGLLAHEVRVRATAAAATGTDIHCLDTPKAPNSRGP